MSNIVKRPGWLTGLAIFIGLQGIVAFIVVFIGLFGRIKPGHEYSNLELALIVVFGVFEIIVARGIFKGQNWSRHFLVAMGWALIAVGFAQESNPNVAYVVLLQSVVVWGFLSWALYGTEGAKRFYANAHNK